MKLLDNLTDAARLASIGAKDFAITQRQRLGALAKVAMGDVAGGSSHQIFTGGTPPDRGTRELLKMATKSPWLSSVLETIAYHVASTEWELYAVRSRGNRKFAKCAALTRSADPQSRADTMDRIRNGETMVLWSERGQYEDQLELMQIVDHPMLDMMHKPNEYLTGRQSVVVTQKSIDLKGESFWWLQKDALGKTVGYWVLPSHWVTETPGTDKPYYKVMAGSKSIEVPQDEMVWHRIPKVADPYSRGSGVGESLADELDTDEYAAGWMKAFFYNRARPDMIVNFEEDQDASLMARAKKEWDDRLRGFWRAHRPHFIGGKITIHELSKSLADIDMTKLRSFERDAIQSVFGVPPECLGQTQNANRATVTQAMRILSQNVVIPRLEMLRDSLQYCLVPLFDERLIVGYKDPTPDDEELRLAYMQARPEAPTRAEWRRRQGLADRGDVDEYHLQGFSTTLVAPDETGNQKSDTSGSAKAQKKSLVTKAAVTDAVVEAALAGLTTEPITKRIDPLWADELSAWINAEAAKTGVFLSLGKFSPVVVEHIQQMGLNRTPLIMETTKKELRKVLGEAIETGLDGKRAGRLVREVMGGDAWRNRSRTIAVTEVNYSSNYGTYYAHQTSGVVEERQWVATVSLWESVRDTHKVLHEQVVPIGQPFKTIDGDSGMYPGDFTKASNNVNCRCTTVAVIDDDIKSADDLAFLAKKFVEDTDGWVDKATDAYFDAFQDQAKQIEQELIDRAS